MIYAQAGISTVGIPEIIPKSIDDFVGINLSNGVGRVDLAGPGPHVAHYDVIACREP